MQYDIDNTPHQELENDFTSLQKALSDVSALTSSCQLVTDQYKQYFIDQRTAEQAIVNETASLQSVQEQVVDSAQVTKQIGEQGIINEIAPLPATVCERLLYRKTIMADSQSPQLETNFDPLSFTLISILVIILFLSQL